MSDGFSYINPVALDAMNVSWGDTALANEFGTTAMASGSDSAAHAAAAMKTEPETPNIWSLTWSIDDYKKWFMGGGAPSMGPLDPAIAGAQAVLMTDELRKRNPEALAKSPLNWKNIIGSVLLVVIGLIVLSRALGMMGEDSAEIVAKFAK